MAVIRVNPGGAGSTPIQDAVDSASPGDVILVANGTYREEVTISTSNIRIIARGDKVFLDGGNTLHTAFQLSSVTGVEINGFRISNYTERGIELSASNFNFITHNIIRKIREDGILLGANSNGNLVLNNIIRKTGGTTDDDSGIQLEFPNRGNWIVNNTVSDNFLFGIQADSINPNSIINNQVINNNFTGIRIESSLNILEKNTVKKNKLNGLVLENDDNFIFRNLFKDNTPNNIVDNGTDNNYVQNKEE